MSNTFEIPAAVIDQARLGLLSLLGDAAEEISDVLTRPEHELNPEWFVRGRDVFERACDLLDIIGWDAKLKPQATCISLDVHGGTLKEALSVLVSQLEAELDEAGVNDVRRAQEGKPPRKDELSRRLRSCRDTAALVERRAKELS